ncbi:hypothetical protein F5883DRAFT_525453 [Diaporthe sp. PMI_573]|nr:hypothetical protein F5883DRAFT_525453 [Diaporthaceae sp. PMI_573]
MDKRSRFYLTFQSVASSYSFEAPYTAALEGGAPDGCPMPCGTTPAAAEAAILEANCKMRVLEEGSKDAIAKIRGFNAAAEEEEEEEAVETVLDNVRVGDAGAVWVCTNRRGPSSTAKKPFFNVWSAPSSCRSAWQPIVGPQSSAMAGTLLPYQAVRSREQDFPQQTCEAGVPASRISDYAPPKTRLGRKGSRSAVPKASVARGSTNIRKINKIRFKKGPRQNHGKNADREFWSQVLCAAE